MGAFSVVQCFDAAKLQRTVSPALREMVGTGRPVPWLAGMVDSRIAAGRRAEDRFAEHYRHRRRPSAELQAARGGLGLSLLGACELVRGDLGLRDLPTLLRRVRPDLTGTCDSTSCPQRADCPLHHAGQAAVTAETFMGLLRDIVEKTCFTGAETVLGRHGQWYDFLDWYTMELGLDPYDHAGEVAERHEGDPVLAHLLRLGKRAAAIGWGDGGFGEGLLGWLDAAETAALVAGLDGYDLTPGAPVPADPALDSLPELRAVVALIRDAGARATAAGHGLGLRRR